MINIIDANTQHFSKIRKLLFEVGFEHMVNDEVWRWEFVDHGLTPIIKIAFDGQHNQIAGHYGMIPMQFCYDGRVYDGGKIEGSATHSDYRGKNILKLYPHLKDFRLFKELVSSVVHEIKRSNVDVIFGFPNDAAKKTQYESGFVESEFTYEHFIRGYNVGSLVSAKLHSFSKLKRIAANCYFTLQKLLRKKAHLHRKYTVREINFKDANVDTLFLSFIKKYNVISIHRDNRYLKWRYADNPIYSNKIFAAYDNNGLVCGFVICGYNMTASYKEAKIEDIAFLDEDPKLIDDLIATAVISLEKYGVDFISGIVVGTRFAFLKKAYQRQGFVGFKRRERNFFYLSEKMKQHGVDFYDPANWYINFSFRQY